MNNVTSLLSNEAPGQGVPAYLAEHLSQIKLSDAGRDDGLDLNPDQIIQKQPAGRSLIHKAKEVAYLGAFAAEVSPLNGIVRYGLLGASLTQTTSALTSAVVLGGSTAVVEGAGAFSASAIVDKNRGYYSQGLIQKILDNKHVRKYSIQMDESKLMKYGVTLYAGTGIMTVLQQSKDPSRTYEKNLRYGLSTAAWLSGVLAVQGALIAEGADRVYNDPAKYGIGAILLGAGYAAFKHLRGKLKNNPAKLGASATQSSDSEQIESGARYDLSEDEVVELEKKLVRLVEQKENANGVYPVIINSKNELANLLRMRESDRFPEVAESIDTDADMRTLFLGLVDTRDDQKRLVHGVTMSLPFDDRDPESKKTGLIIIDDLIDDSLVTKEMFVTACKNKNIDPEKILSIETNWRIGPKSPKYGGVTVPELAYAYMNEYLRHMTGDDPRSAVVAAVNRFSILSFKMRSMDYVVLDELNPDYPDDNDPRRDYTLVALLNTEHNKKVFAAASNGIEPFIHL